MKDLTIEIEDIRRELFREDVYRAERVFHPSQVWLDVGCHVGLFTTLAQAYGASVAGGVDASSLMVDTYQNTHHQTALQRCIYEATDIVDALASLGRTADRCNALKLDIQGSEVPILTTIREATILSLLFETLLVEFHDTTRLTEALLVLEASGYSIDFADAASDGLTGEPTFIIHAHQ